MINPREAIPRSWLDYLGGGSLGVGMDLGTTDKGTSNPSAITVAERDGRGFKGRLVVAWKTANPDISEGILRMILADLEDAGKPARRVCLDASNETFFCKHLKKSLSRYAPFSLIKGGENLTFEGEEHQAKTLLGNLYVNALEDGLWTLPSGEFIRDDQRLVAKQKGSFISATSNSGQHGDTFDSCKLAQWALIKGGGRVQAEAVAVGGSQNKPLRPGLIGPIGRIIKSVLNS
jgi:hypothetical protein